VTQEILAKQANKVAYRAAAPGKRSDIVSQYTYNDNEFSKLHATIPHRLGLKITTVALDCVHRDLLPTPEYAMSGTPRLRSSYPTTPTSDQKTYDIRKSSPSRPRTSLPNLPDNGPATAVPGSGPLVPVHLVEAPTQRFYIALIYGLLVMWLLYDWVKLVEDETQSIGLFFKWTCIFAILSYGVPQLRIPWLEWSYTMSNAFFLLHSGLAFMLMFRVPVRYKIPSYRERR
jgi:hypothetical protein